MLPASYHRGAFHMTDAMKTAFPDVDYVIAVKLPAIANTADDPQVKVYVGVSKKLGGNRPLLETDLRKTTAAGGERLAPDMEKDEFLVLITPDEKASYCTSVPRWVWI